MLSKILTFGLFGIDAYPVEVEVDVTQGLPAINIIGLVDTAIKESYGRVKTAIKNCGYHWPAERITISLSPSYMRKEGPGFDLAIALGILCASNQINGKDLAGYCVIGELSLGGIIRPCRGILPISLAMAKHKIKDLILPLGNAKEAGMISAISAWPVATLNEAIELLNNPQAFHPYAIDIKDIFASQGNYPVDLAEIKGQQAAKRALEVAVCGNHNILMIGPPGSGKTMLAKRVPTILPDLTLEESLEITRIHSAAGKLSANSGLIATRPFRSPHHAISEAGMAGGGAIPQPGEISLAHLGVLFLDELPELKRGCLETLRQPLEDGNIHITRAIRSFIFPASFMLVGAMNPCPCGFLTDPRKPCRCNPAKIQNYISKISGPLLDRLDIHIDVPAVKYQELSRDLPAESSAAVKARVNRTRAIQRERFKDEGILCNGQMSHKQIREFCALGTQESELLRTAMTELDLSARAYNRILKVSRTIADMAECDRIASAHIAEAIQYRSLDRNLFL